MSVKATQWLRCKDSRDYLARCSTSSRDSCLTAHRDRACPSLSIAPTGPIVEPWPHEAGRRTSFRCVFFRRQEQVVSMNEASAIARPQRTQGMLFGDPLPQLDADSGYRGPVACRAAGITYRQLEALRTVVVAEVHSPQAR